MGHAMYRKMLQVSSMSILIFIKNIIERVSELLITKFFKKKVTIFLSSSFVHISYFYDITKILFEYYFLSTFLADTSYLYFAQLSEMDKINMCDNIDRSFI